MFLVLKLIILIQTVRANLIFKSDGEVNFIFLIQDCNREFSSASNTLIDSAIWTTNRLNVIKKTGILNFGIRVYKVCNLDDYYSAIYKSFEKRNVENVIGIIVDKFLLGKVEEFVAVLGFDVLEIYKNFDGLIKGSVVLLNVLNWKEDVVVVAPNQVVLKEFYKYTRRLWICVKKFYSYYDNNLHTIDPRDKIIFLGNSEDIANSIKQINITGDEDLQIIIVPFDNIEINNSPIGSYIILPQYSDPKTEYKLPEKVLPTPILFEVASPLLTFTENIAEICNETKCIQKVQKTSKQIFEPTEILNILKLKPLTNDFIYNIYKIENPTNSKLGMNNQSFDYLKYFGDKIYTKTFTFNPIDLNLTDLENLERKGNKTSNDCENQFDRCILQCENFKSFELAQIFENFRFNLRSEPWVYAFLSLSCLGIIFSISILIFVITRLCKKNVLEGNPILSIFLLLSVALMYLGVLPFSIQGNKETRYAIFLARYLFVTSIYSFSFSLILSRIILLATVSKEIGFLSHIAGSVQIFLFIFIFAVQIALSLQFLNSCENVLKTGNSFLYLLSYNVILLVLLFLIVPLVTKSQRNYREGKYFTVAIIVLVIVWSCWVPGYLVLDEPWKDPMLCLGLVSTASILLGAVFIPRTYLMTVSAAREQFSNALPSLATATSAMDIYRASTQPVYDCVNIATVNALSSNNNLRSITGNNLLPPADFYSSPDMPEDNDEEFEITHCDTPPPDKVTRF